MPTIDSSRIMSFQDYDATLGQEQGTKKYVYIQTVSSVASTYSTIT